ncbi:hypothetical protein BDU57DRAFT_522883 [Ampelomyces quisqualis]|uniref:Uncharacterized protein n=1 Tax=Ampelomyces quisqualis TaxID=50730 RepID=A0A6A5QAK5_AMPQU|nr:hypothetical protein BDU57DRAFT_522883 [Ampelomyces quisqualis]
MLQMHRLRRATEVSKGFYRLPPPPISQMEPEHACLPAQTVPPSPMAVEHTLISSPPHARTRRTANCRSAAMHFLGSSG